MSAGRLLVRFQDGTVLCGVYSGTVDCCRIDLAAKQEDLRASSVRRRCTDTRNKRHKDEAVEIWTSYGSGFSWHGRACRDCWHLTHGLSPHEGKLPGKGTPVADTREDGTPDWVTEFLSRQKDSC